MKKNVFISYDFLEHLLNCLAAQKFIGKGPPNGDAVSLGQEQFERIELQNQKVIDEAWLEGMRILKEGI